MRVKFSSFDKHVLNLSLSSLANDLQLENIYI